METSSLSSSSGIMNPEITSLPKPISTGPVSASENGAEKSEGILIADPVSFTGGIVNTQV
ncbi:hypothetical protein [Leptospira alstonii]|nr:hypothetical protein [Leptospira alstonii]